MSLLYVGLISIAIFLALFIFSQFWKASALFSLGIGGGVNANFFSIGDYVMVTGPLVFGLDGALHTLFVFIVIYMFLTRGEKNSRNVCLCTVFGIIFAGILDYLCTLLTGGIVSVWSISSYLISALATFACAESGIWVSKMMKEHKWNKYLNLVLSMLVATVVNSVLYFGLVALFQGGFSSNFGYILAGSIVVKVFCILLSCLTYFGLEHVKRWKIVNPTTEIEEISETDEK